MYPLNDAINLFNLYEDKDYFLIEAIMPSFKPSLLKLIADEYSVTLQYGNSQRSYVMPTPFDATDPITQFDGNRVQIYIPKMAMSWASVLPPTE